MHTIQLLTCENVYNVVSRLMMTTYKPSSFGVLHRRYAQLVEAGWKQIKIAQFLNSNEGVDNRMLNDYHQDDKAALAWRKLTKLVSRLTNEHIDIRSG